MAERRKLRRLIPVKKKEKKKYIVVKRPPVVYDEDGWAHHPTYNPPDYELVEVEDAKGKRQYGWWAKSKWEYGIIHLQAEVVKWRFMMQWVEI